MKRTLSLLLSLMLVFTFSVAVAAEGTEGIDSTEEESVVADSMLEDVSEDLEDANIENSDDGNDLTVEESTVFSINDEPSERIVFSDSPPVIQEIPVIDSSELEPCDTSLIGRTIPNVVLDEKDRLPDTPSQRSPVSETAIFNVLLEEDGDMGWVSITMSDGDIVHATLAGPLDTNSDYDLFIFDADGEIVASSALTANFEFYPDYGQTKAMDESVSFIHRGSTADYVVAAYAYSGSAQSGTLTISMDDSSYLDFYEPNDFAGDAQSLPSFPRNVTAGFNVPNDVDFYYINNSSGQYKSVEVSVPAGIVVDTYYLNPNTGTLDLQAKTGSTHVTPAGEIYFRVYRNTTSTAVQSYTISFANGAPVPARWHVVHNGDMGSAQITLLGVRAHIFKNTYSPEIYVLDSEGRGVPNIEVRIQYQSAGWNPGTANHLRDYPIGSSTGYITDENGKVAPSCALPTAYPNYKDRYGSPIVFEYTFDYDHIWIYTPNMELDDYEFSFFHLFNSVYIGG